MDRLRTECVLLDPLAREDFAWLFALYADAEVMRYIGRGPRTEEESRRNLDWLLAHGERLPFGYWVLREHATGERVGGAVLMIRREGAPVELGFMLARPAPSTPAPSAAKPANTQSIRIDVIPGSIWRYSGGGYTIMQLAMTDVTGQPFPEIMRDTVLSKAGMRDTGLHPGPYGGLDRRFELTREEWLSSRTTGRGAR